MAGTVKPTRVQTARNGLLFALGLAGVIDQAFVRSHVDPVPFAVFTALLGAPAALEGVSISVRRNRP